MVINNFLHNFYSLYTPAAVPSLLSPQSCPYKPLPSLLIFLLRDPTGLSTASPTEAQATESETALLLSLLGVPEEDQAYNHNIHAKDLGQTMQVLLPLLQSREPL